MLDAARASLRLLAGELDVDPDARRAARSWPPTSSRRHAASRPRPRGRGWSRRSRWRGRVGARRRRRGRGSGAPPAPSRSSRPTSATRARRTPSTTPRATSCRGTRPRRRSLLLELALNGRDRAARAPAAAGQWHDRLMDAITHPPAPPTSRYAATPPAALSATGSQALDELAAPAELTMTIGGDRGWAGGDPFDVVAPHATSSCSAASAQATGADVDAAIGAALAAAPAWRELPFDERAAVFLRAADLLAGPWRDRSTPPPCSASRRRRSRPRSTRPASSSTSCGSTSTSPAQILDRAAASAARRLEPDGVPAARGLRPRDHAVQLHRDRRQPAHRAGADGQRRGVEAVADAAAGRALHDAAARGGRAAAGRDQHGDRRRRRGQRRSRCRTRTWPASTSPARPRRSSTCGAPSARTSTGYRELPAAGRRDRRQGLRGRAPRADLDVAGAPRWSAARSSTRARSARPPRAPTCRARCGTPAARRAGRRRPSR